MTALDTVVLDAEVAFAFYDQDAPLPSAAPFFPGSSACRAIRQTLSPPRRELKAWYLVIKNDGMDALRPWVCERGYRCFKIKLLGRDNDHDVARTVEVYRIVRELGAENVELSIDTNEANPDAASVVDYLQSLRTADADAYAALQYVEQPTGRDITKHCFDWREAAALRPVLLDEGLTRLEHMPVAREQGLKLSMQDLTNPGLSLIHAALFAGHLPTINGVELNSPQFTPAANTSWLPRLAPLFEPRDGRHHLPETIPSGLGSQL